MGRTALVRPRRRAIASLELVLVFPFLLTIVVVLFLIAKADVAKVQAATDARRQTWQARARAPGGDRLKPWHNPKDSRIGSQPQRPVLAGPPFSRQTFRARSGNGLIANPWASQAIPFPSLKQNIKPHTSVLSLIATNVAASSFNALSAAFDPGTNPLMIAASTAGKYTGNPAVIVAGIYLKYVAGAAMSVQVDILNGMWDALEVATLGFAGHTSKGKKIKKALNDLANFLNCFDNLYEAAKGRTGADPFND